MQLNQFQFLLALEQYGSFSGAAVGLEVPQSSISTAIRSIEKELNCQLVIRSKTGVKFTPMGKAALETARVVADSVQNINNLIVENSKLNHPFRVGAVQYLCNSVVMNAFLATKYDYPDSKVSIEINPDNSPDLITSLMNGELDYALVVSRTLTQKDMRSAVMAGVRFDEVFTQRIVFSVREGHPLTLKPHVHIRDVLEYPFVCFTNPMDPILERLFKQYNARPSVTFLNDIFSSRRHICSTDSVIFSDEFAVRNGNTVFEDKLTMLDTEDLHETCTILLARMSENSSKLDKAFVEHIYDVCRSLGLTVGGNVL